jgi:hypothetical protein
MFKPWVHGFDGAAYYSWLRSAAMDHDIDLANEYAYFQEQEGIIIVEDLPLSAGGLIISHYPIGSAIMWAPFFIGADVVSRSLNAAGFAVPLDGFSGLYVLFTTWSSTLYGFLAVLIGYAIAREIYSDESATLAAATVWLASPLVFYMFAHPSMAHANDAFINAFFVWMWLRTRHRDTLWRFALLGAIGGLAALVRTQNVLIFTFPVLELIYAGLCAAGGRSWREVGGRALRLALLGLSALFAFLPQILVWRIMYGAWLVVNPQATTTVWRFDWHAPHLAEVFFSSDRGLFIWHPVLLPSIAGLYFLFRRDRRLAAFLLVSFLAQLYVIASWSGWSGGASFGNRFFINSTLVFILGLCGSVDWARAVVRWRWLITAASALIAWNGLLIVQYSFGLIPRYGPVSIRQMVANQFLIVPRYGHQILQQIFDRSRPGP